MQNNLKYLVDDNGQKTSVLVPIKVWENLNANYQKMQRKLEILSGIKEGLKEVEVSQKSNKPLQTLNDFLQ